MTNSKPIGVAYSDPALDGATLDNSPIGSFTPSTGAFTSITSTLGIVTGTSGVPISKSSGNINQTYGTATNTSGDLRAWYMKLNFTGVGGSGETLRAFTTVAAAVATGGTVNGAHISLSVNAGGSISGAGNALRVTLGAAADTTPGGTLSVIQLDSDISTSSTMPTSVAFLRVTDTGVGKIPNLFNLPAPASNTIFRAKSSAAVTHVIKIIADNGTPYYIMVSDAV